MTGLDLRSVIVRFAGLGQPALDIPSLSLAPGEQAALTGPSGCGKTTLVNVLTGLERVSEGAIAWFGTDLARLSESARDRWRAAHIGLVMQEFHLFPGLSAFENVVLPQRLRHLRLPDKVREEANRLLARVAIERRDQPVETMSRGQMQRVAVARALVARPKIIIADEPTASLDPEAGAAVADLIVDLAAEIGAILIVASHDRRFVDRLSRVLRLEAGRLVLTEDMQDAAIRGS